MDTALHTYIFPPNLTLIAILVSGACKHRSITSTSKCLCLVAMSDGGLKAFDSEAGMLGDSSSSIFSNTFTYHFCISSEFAKALKRKCDAHKLLICIMQGESVFSIVNKFLSLTSICGKKTNQIWVSVVCTLIDNDTHHHSGQNLWWTRESTTFWPLRWPIWLPIRVQTTLNHIQDLSNLRGLFEQTSLWLYDFI